MVRERDHVTHRRTPPCRGAGDALPGGTGRDGGAALPGDLAAGAGADDPRGGRGAGLRAALGDAAGGALQRPRPRGARRWAAAQRQGRQPAGPGPAGRLRKGLEEAVAQAKTAHPDRPVEVWAEDEHRLGLKPVRRRVWAPVGQRPIALGLHRYQWLHVVAFVQPTSGETVWYLATGLSKPWDRVVSRDRPVEALGPCGISRPACR